MKCPQGASPWLSIPCTVRSSPRHPLSCTTLVPELRELWPEHPEHPEHPPHLWRPLKDEPVGFSVGFSTMRVVKHWHRTPREVVAALLQEIFKVRLDVLLSSGRCSWSLQGIWTRWVLKVSSNPKCVMIL